MDHLQVAGPLLWRVEACLLFAFQAHQPQGPAVRTHFRLWACCADAADAERAGNMCFQEKRCVLPRTRCPAGFPRSLAFFLVGLVRARAGGVCLCLLVLCVGAWRKGFFAVTGSLTALVVLQGVPPARPLHEHAVQGYAAPEPAAAAPRPTAVAAAGWRMCHFWSGSDVETDPTRPRVSEHVRVGVGF